MAETSQEERRLETVPQPRRRWQFSIRFMLELTTVVAVVLSLAKTFPWFVFVLIGLAVIACLGTVTFFIALGAVLLADGILGILDWIIDAVRGEGGETRRSS